MSVTTESQPRRTARTHAAAHADIVAAACDVADAVVGHAEHPLWPAIFKSVRAALQHAALGAFTAGLTEGRVSAAVAGECLIAAWAEALRLDPPRSAAPAGAADLRSTGGAPPPARGGAAESRDEAP